MLFVDPSPLLRQRITETQFFIAGFPDTPPLFAGQLGAYATPFPPVLRREFPSSGGKHGTGGRLGQFSHNGIVPVVETVLQLVQVRSDRRLLFSQSLLSFLGLLLRAALRPGNRDCTGEVPVPDTGRTAGGPCAPPPLGKDPPHPSKTFFRCWSRAAARSWGQGRAVNRPDQPPCQVDTGRGVLKPGPPPLPISAPSPAFRCQAPADAHLSAFEWAKVRAGPVRRFWGILRAAFPWIEPGPGANVSLLPTKDPRGAAN